MERLSTMPRLRMHLEHYDESHRKLGNKLLHFVGIPLLLISFLGLLSKLSLNSGAEMPALRPNAAWIVLIGAALWYIWLAWRIGFLTIALWAICYVLGSEVPAGQLAILFGIGVVAHVIGHYAIERKPPAVLSRPVAVLEAPVWLVAICAGLYR
ncbi:MAG TPA: Mpo1-like protein [Gemmataceae bacterium]|nr:Mpo1-like protein [Gemmataceae bacterium]